MCIIPPRLVGVFRVRVHGASEARRRRADDPPPRVTPRLLRLRAVRGLEIDGLGRDARLLFFDALRHAGGRVRLVLMPFRSIQEAANLSDTRVWHLIQGLESFCAPSATRQRRRALATAASTRRAPPRSRRRSACTHAETHTHKRTPNTNAHQTQNMRRALIIHGAARCSRRGEGCGMLFAASHCRESTTTCC